jgi:seryl-tRNA synthetase
MVLRSANPQQGPWAVPGKYQVKLTVDGVTQTREFTLLADPRLKDVSQADLEEQFKLSMQIRDRVSDANEAVIRIRDLKKQITARSAAAHDAQLTAAGEAVAHKLSAVEEELYQVKNQSSKDVLALPIKLNNRLAALLRVAQSADARPTNQTYIVFKQLKADLDAQLSALDQVVKTDLAQFNALLTTRNLVVVR